MKPDKPLNLFLPTFQQKDAQVLTGASRASVNNWLGRAYIQLCWHPKAEALGGRLFSFYDTLKLEVMWQLSRLKVQAKFASEAGDLVMARADMMTHNREEAAKNPMEVLLSATDNEVKHYCRFPTRKYYDLDNPYIVIPCDRLFYRLFNRVYEYSRLGMLKTDIQVMQSAYTEQEQMDIFDMLQGYIFQYQEIIEDSLSMQMIESE